MQSYSDHFTPFVSGKTLALWATGLLGAVAAADFLMLCVSAAQLFVASSYPETASAALGAGDADFTELPGGVMQTAVLALAVTTGGLYTLLIITTIVVFLVWENRAHKNLRALGVANAEYSSGWAIGSWFVPFANLVVPFRAVREIWWKSDPDTVPQSADGGGYNAFAHFQGSVSLLTGWWTFWIISNLVSNASTRLSWRASDLSQHVIAEWLSIFAAILSIIAAVLAINVVRGINARQEERHKRLMTASQRQFWSQTPSGADAAPPNFS